MNKISFILPSRDNLKYLKWSYQSIRTNLKTQHEICMYDDFSSDGTWEWMTGISKIDHNVKIFRNEGPTRLGHTILYDELIKNASNEVVMIWHADMYAFPGLDDAIFKNISRRKIVSLTRIEPPLHPPGPEKITQDWGTEPEQFDQNAAKDFVEDFKKHYNGQMTNGIFAPWAIYKTDFQSIGGHDPLFAPQSREDSDIFNRFLLAGFELVQTWEGFVYHMTCRGSRFNPNITTVGQASPEWLAQNKRSERNFIRKWGSHIKHDDKLLPVVSKKYNIEFILKNLFAVEILNILEPHCDKLIIDNTMTPDFMTDHLIESYIKTEQPNTKFDLKSKIIEYKTNDAIPYADVIVEFDCSNIKAEDISLLSVLPEMITDVSGIGVYEIENLRVKILSLESHEKDLINLKK